MAQKVYFRASENILEKSASEDIPICIVKANYFFLLGFLYAFSYEFYILGNKLSDIIFTAIIDINSPKSNNHTK